MKKRKKESVQFNVALCIMLIVFIGGCVTYYKNNINAQPCVGQTKNISDDGHFDAALRVVLKHEGYLSNVKGDAGGLTKYGLSYRYLSALVEQDPVMASEIDVNHNYVLDTYDVYHLSLETASKIYKQEFWDKYKLNKIKSAPLAIKLFDLSVNMGHNQMTKILARAYRSAFSPKASSVDYTAINMLTPADNNLLLNHICIEAKDYYQEIAKIHPVYKKFLNGWLNRVKEGC